MSADFLLPAPALASGCASASVCQSVCMHGVHACLSVYMHGMHACIFACAHIDSDACTHVSPSASVCQRASVYLCVRLYMSTHVYMPTHACFVVCRLRLTSTVTDGQTDRERHSDSDSETELNRGKWGTKRETFLFPPKLNH